ncbi:MAG: multiheme c-type cytochrome [Isosphaeraceae bacterium]
MKILARATARQGKDETAKAIYLRLGRESMDAEDFLLLAWIFSRGDQKSLARSSLEVARQLEPENSELLETLFRFELDDRALSQAAADADRLSRQPGWEVRGMVALAEVKHLLHEPGASVELLRRALDLDPELRGCRVSPRNARRLLATCLLETGSPSEARAELEALLAAGADAELSWLLSRALLMEKRTAQAAEVAQQARSQGVDDPMRSEPAPFVGAASCESCHPREYRALGQSNHSRTLLRGKELEHLPWPVEPLLDGSNPGVSHEFARTDRGIEFRTKVDQQAYAAIVEYAMGSTHQGRSFVGREPGGRARELRISQYPREPIWSLTMDHPDRATDPSDYVGRALDQETFRRCLNCHSTNFQAIQHSQGKPEALDPGIGCERCHGPGGHHRAAVEAGFPELALVRPKRARADQVTGLCSQCHSPPTTMDLSDPRAIRFQGPTFSRSRCYTESGSFSCVSCHNPHRNAGRNPTEYEAICLKCHPSSSNQENERVADLPGGRTWVPCPIRPDGDCLSCHMPRVRDVVPRSMFTDHYIRIRPKPSAR